MMEIMVPNKILLLMLQAYLLEGQTFVCYELLQMGNGLLVTRKH